MTLRLIQPQAVPKQFRTAVVERPHKRKWVVHVDQFEPIEFDDRETATAFAQSIGWSRDVARAALRRGADDAAAERPAD